MGSTTPLPDDENNLKSTFINTQKETPYQKQLKVFLEKRKRFDKIKKWSNKNIKKHTVTGSTTFQSDYGIPGQMTMGGDYFKN